MSEDLQQFQKLYTEDPVLVDDPQHEIPGPSGKDASNSADGVSAPEAPADPTPEHGEPFGKNERALGVATNRAIHDPYWDKTRTAVRYSAIGMVITIDLENDPPLVDFLQNIKRAAEEAGQLDAPVLAEKATRQVVAQTPDIDTDGSVHDGRNITLGEALQHPVMCLDRALAMEAALTMLGFKDVEQLPSMIRFPNPRDDTPHLDVTFTVDGERYVAVTTGPAAGGVMPIDMYTGSHNKLLQALDQGVADIQWHFAISYFQAAQ